MFDDFQRTCARSRRVDEVDVNEKAKTNQIVKERIINFETFMNDSTELWRVHFSSQFSQASWVVYMASTNTPTILLHSLTFSCTLLHHSISWVLASIAK